MEKSLIPFCLLAIFMTALPAQAALHGDSLVRAGTPEAAKVISALEQARHIDRMDAQSYMGSANRDAGLFYYQKHQEIDALLKRLRQGEPVSLDDVQRALNNRNAIRYGSIF